MRLGGREGHKKRLIVGTDDGHACMQGGLGCLRHFASHAHAHHHLLKS